VEDQNQTQSTNHPSESIKKVSGMYKEWFLDYASYVILERAIPKLNDGFKPVQRRILHSMKELEDGRYNKVANVVGNTMKYHPHGDAAISDAMVQLGQKELLIDTQGNWGNIFTGDAAAAARYIEARLTKFALEVVFNAKTTHWQLSYDGRNKEPQHFPVKFPVLLAQGVEGIAVGLSTKILPCNFIELIDASIKHLEGKEFRIYPDFITGGSIDITDFNDGKRGGRVKVRAKMAIQDKDTLVITEIPFGTTTGSLIDSILKANDKGKIRVKKVEDNTAEFVEILVHLNSGVSPDKTIDALYAFTDCEISLSPNACVIENNKPYFFSISDILKVNTNNTVDLLKKELEIELNELQEEWHASSLERIFIDKKIYRDIEEETTWEGVIQAIDLGLKPYTKDLFRQVTEEDIVRLTEIKIKRISKFDLNKAEEYIKSLEDKIEKVKHNLAHLIAFAIAYYKNLLKNYGKGRERKTEIKLFDTIDATKVAANNTKLYINKQEGFIGTSLKKDEFAFDCSDIDDIIVFLKDGTMLITKVEAKTFVGKNIIHIGVWKKKDKRTVYNVMYKEGGSNIAYMKRFPVTSITRNKEYNVSQVEKGSEVLYFSCNPNGEAEVVTVFLKPLSKLKKLYFDVNFSQLAIKSRESRGNLVSKNAIKKIELKEKGGSTLSARKIWFDNNVLRLNTEGRGELVGEFGGEDKLLVMNAKGEAKLVSTDLSTHFENDLLVLEKWNPKKVISCVYYNGEKAKYFVKRFLIEEAKNTQVFFDLEDDKSFIEMVSTDDFIEIEVSFSKTNNKDTLPETIALHEFIEPKGIKSIGNQLSGKEITNIALIKSENKPTKPTTQQNSEENLSANENPNNPDNITQSTLDF
jgi:topoisomerase IV subunit A